MEVVKVQDKDAVVIFLERIKLMVLKVDESVMEFGIIALFNFENDTRLQESGKKMPLAGMLRTISTPTSSAFGLIADDSTFIYIKTKQHASTDSAP